jgi:hypothetical protein
MATLLTKPIKRELEIEGVSYTITMSPDGVRIVPKGRRNGRELTWRDLLGGDAEMRRDLDTSVQAYQG